MSPKKMPPALQMATPGTKQRRASDLFGDAAESSSVMDIDDQPTPTPINPDPNRYTQSQETQCHGAWTLVSCIACLVTLTRLV